MRRPGPLLLTLLATIALVIGSAAHAHAQPSPAEIEAQIDAKWNEIEPVIEEHNAVRIKLDLERKKADALAAQLAPLEQAVGAAGAGGLRDSDAGRDIRRIHV